MKSIYYGIVAILIWIISGTECLAQNIQWDTGSQTGFVFEISNREAQKLLTLNSPDTIINGMLHTLTDTFDVEKGWTERPEKGHFIMARIVGNKLHCEYTSVFPYQVFLMKEYNALSLQVLDLEGNIREDARVKFRWNRLRIDPETKTYRLENGWFGGDHRIVTVELDGFRSVFNITKHAVPDWYHGGYNDEDEGPVFYSYMITDKNKYRPNETVRFKSYALAQTRNPLRRELELWLLRDGKQVRIAEVLPHRPGSFAGEFFLHDSLGLTLDKRYVLQLRERKGRIVASCNFRYEDYELHGNQLELQLANRRQYHPAANELTITATDINGLFLKDARASVLVRPRMIRETFQPLAVLADTLMFAELDLASDGPTTLEIPSDLFLKTNTAYDIVVAVRNAENALMEKTIDAVHYYEQFELVPRFSGDSIVYEILGNGVPLNDITMTMRHGDERSARQVTLPYREKLNPLVSIVHFEGKLFSKTIYMRDMIPRLELEGGIERDSFNIVLRNPQMLDVSWFLYQGSRLLQKGFGKEVEYRSLITDRGQTYYVELLYSFGGEEHVRRTEYAFKDDMLDVSLDIPDRIYPGQQVAATIQVLDQRGNPVSGVDLTAVAVNGKLNYRHPDLSYYGDRSVDRERKAHYSKTDVSKRFAVLQLDYNLWAQRARLDTMRYYQFIYPGSGMFRYAVDADVTQFAPFVMQNGDGRQIFVIEVDKQPVYYSWTDQPREYSFNVSPGQPHEVTLRLHDRVLILDSVVFEAGRKTIISIDADRLPSNVGVHTLFTPAKKKRKRWHATHPAFTQVEVRRHLNYVAAFQAVDTTAWLESPGSFTPLFDMRGPVRQPYILVGPINPGKKTFNARDLKTTYEHSGGYLYAFEDNIVYKLNVDNLLPDVLRDHRFPPADRLNDHLMTKERFLAQKAEAGSLWHARAIQMVDHSARVTVTLPAERDSTGIAVFLFQECGSGKIVSPCRTRHTTGSDYFTIPRGCHNAILVYNNGKYLKMDSINILSYHHTVIDLRGMKLQAADSASAKWRLTAGSNCYGTVSAPARTLALRFERRSGNVRGIIYDESNMGLPGATIVEKGTANGTVTDIDGEFSMNISRSPATLVVSFIGYATKEIEVQVGADVTVYLEPDVMELSEVVVVGYGMAVDKRSLAQALSGRVAGVSMEPGIVEEESDEGMLVKEKEELHVAEDISAEEELYRQLLTLNSIRSNFSDVGFWEPRLYTDKKGESKFSVTFPDDLTRWDITVYAMNRFLQTGTFRNRIRSYKPIMAELSTPRFLTVGDSALLSGKILNYSDDATITGQVQWTGASTDLIRDIRFTDFHTDPLPVYVSDTDSVTTRYVFTRDDGYLDGEERTIPVVEQGTVRADGTLRVLAHDEDVAVRAESGEQVTVEVLSSQLDIYKGEARSLLDYRYDCNEQLASKLIGLLNYRLVTRYEGDGFRYDRDINRIISRLLKNQNTEFLWSWWDLSPNTSYWISAHILRALKAAQEAGFKVALNVDNLARKASYKFDMLGRYDWSDADLLHALASWKTNINYEKYIGRIDSMIVQRENKRGKKLSPGYYPYSNLKEKLLLLEIRQMSGLPWNRDSLLRYQRQGIPGGIYFSDRRPARQWYGDDLSVNTIAYRIVKRDPELQHLTSPMQLYFLQERKKGGWNTYHSSNVLMSVLSNLLEEGATKERSAELTVTGKDNDVVTKFPWRMTLAPGEEVRVRKGPGLPLYFMEYVQERVTEAATGVAGFNIRTSIDGQDSVLEAGKPVTLRVEVDVLKDAADYVMIEVPIPASCSYADKAQSHSRVETHREYFKERTMIFCEKMPKGRYSFAIALLPRFSGKYHINPAQVSLMYFPVVNANTAIKTVTVK